MNVSSDIRYIGVDDKDIDLFEGQYIVPDGMMYNSYVILDEKIAVMDTVDARFGEEWLGKLEEVLEGRTPDYLIVQHMEPDHSANIKLFTDKYPESVVVATAKAFPMMKNFYGLDFSGRRGRKASARQPRADLHHRAYGPLAGGNGDLRSQGQGPLLR